MKKSVLVLFSLMHFTLLAQNNELINQIALKLKQGKTTVSDVLTDEAYMHLHPETAFREVIRLNANEAHIRLTSYKEPGERITVKGTIVDQSGKAQSNVIIYVYQTSHKGWYGIDRPHFRMANGDHGHARIFGYIKSDAAGAFSFETIKPQGYPDSDLPAHIHIHLQTKEGKHLPAPLELLFEDDKRLTAERRNSALGSGFLISKNSGTTQHPVYSYRLITG